MKRAAGALVITLAMSVLASCADSPPPPSHIPSPAHAVPPGHAAVAATRPAQLYPANNAAQPGGVRTGELTDEGNGHGTFKFTMPYGETVGGEYSPVAGGTVGFGSIYNAVFGPQGVGATKAPPSGTPGKVSGYGVGGTRIECEYYSNAASGHASGACSTSTGFLYRLQF